MAHTLAIVEPIWLMLLRNFERETNYHGTDGHICVVCIVKIGSYTILEVLVNWVWQVNEHVLQLLETSRNVNNNC